MTENTPDERRMIAAEAIAKRGDAFVIETEDELVQVYRDYARADLMSRQMSDDLTDSQKRNVNLSANLYADLASETFVHDLPAIRFLLSRYRGR